MPLKDELLSLLPPAAIGVYSFAKTQELRSEIEDLKSYVWCLFALNFLNSVVVLWLLISMKG